MTKKKSDATKKAAPARKAAAPKEPVVEEAVAQEEQELDPVLETDAEEAVPQEARVLREEGIRRPEAVVTPEEFTCHLCGVKQTTPLLVGQFCAICHDHVQQAYQWLQSPMLTASEYKSLQKKIMDLTDVKNVKLE